MRYAEIDGQRVVFNSRYLEYADVAVSEFWDWTGIAAALGAAWTDTEFHVRRAEVDYLKPFIWGDTVEAFVQIARIGTSSLTHRFDLCHAVTGECHATIEMVVVNVHLPSGKALAIPQAIRTFLKAMPGDTGPAPTVHPQ